MTDDHLKTYHRVRVDSFPGGPFVDTVLDYSPALVGAVGKDGGFLLFDRGRQTLCFRAPGDRFAGPAVLVNCDGNYRLFSGDERYWVTLCLDISDLAGNDTFIERHLWVEHFVPRNERVRDLDGHETETPVTPPPRPVTRLVPLDKQRSDFNLDQLDEAVARVREDPRPAIAYALVIVRADGTSRYIHNVGVSELGTLALMGAVHRLGFDIADAHVLKVTGDEPDGAG